MIPSSKACCGVEYATRATSRIRTARVVVVSAAAGGDNDREGG